MSKTFDGWCTMKVRGEEERKTQREMDEALWPASGRRGREEENVQEDVTLWSAPSAAQECPCSAKMLNQHYNIIRRLQSAEHGHLSDPTRASLYARVCVLEWRENRPDGLTSVETVEG
ncbi:hypothetical protein MHYP_G00045770 [Metynnis hypsauchen]